MMHLTDEELDQLYNHLMEEGHIETNTAVFELGEVTLMIDYNLMCEAIENFVLGDKLAIKNLYLTVITHIFNEFI